MAGRTLRYQGGSIVSFIIITVIVIAALGVGLYVLRQRSEQSRISSTTTQDIPPELPGVADGEKKDGTDSEAFPSSSKETTKDAKPSTAPSTGTGNTSSDKEASSSSAASSAATLPETGPEQLLIIPVLAIVVYVVVAYTGSSRQLSRLR